MPNRSDAGSDITWKCQCQALTAGVAAGPGMWEDEDWLAALRRDGLVAELLAGRVIERAAADGGHGHRRSGR